MNELPARPEILGHARLASCAEKMISNSRRLHSATLPHHRTSLQSQIAATDRQIDALVYELYGLTDEEIRIVEGETDESPPASAPPPSDGAHQRNGQPEIAMSHDEEALPPDIAEAVAQLKGFDETKLRDAAADVLSPKEVRRLETLNRKAQNESLTVAEEEERDELSHRYEKALVVRATALAELHKRGVDVADLIAP